MENLMDLVARHDLAISGSLGPGNNQTLHLLRTK